MFLCARSFFKKSLKGVCTCHNCLSYGKVSTNSIIYDTLWSVRNRIFSVQIELLLLIASETFFNSSVVPSFLVRKAWWRNRATVARYSRRVGTHEKNSGKLFIDWAQLFKAFFVPNQEPAFAWPFGNGPMRVGTQGLFRPCLKTFVAPFLPAWLTAPGLQRMQFHGCLWKYTNTMKMS